MSQHGLQRLLQMVFAGFGSKFHFGLKGRVQPRGQNPNNRKIHFKMNFERESGGDSR